MSESFGLRLRAQRERRQVTLASIAAATKINVSLLEALERDDVSHWPPGIFRRAFVRAYAEAIGLDADAVAHEFLSRFPDSDDEPTRGSVHDWVGVEATPLRLTLADEGAARPGRQIVTRLSRRWKGVAFDVGALLVAALGASLVFDQVWMPLGIAALGYYAVSVLVLGNTVGVVFFAGGQR